MSFALSPPLRAPAKKLGRLDQLTTNAELNAPEQEALKKAIAYAREAAPAVGRYVEVQVSGELELEDGRNGLTVSIIEVSAEAAGEEAPTEASEPGGMRGRMATIHDQSQAAAIRAEEEAEREAKRLEALQPPDEE